MSSIQGVGALTAAYPVAPKAQASSAPAVTSESREPAQVERAEATRGAQESGEGESTRSPNPAIGSKLSILA